jgi:predicted enzyme related to lactoylglutathione lyase
MAPTSINGRICYLEMPAADVAQSAAFYARVFGWRLRKRGDGATAFDDATGEVSGSWVTGRPAATAPGLLFYIMVDSVESTVREVVAAGGTLVQPVGADAPEITARFRDPGGNIIGLYQEPAKPGKPA